MQHKVKLSGTLGLSPMSSVIFAYCNKSGDILSMSGQQIVHFGYLTLCM